MLAILGGLLALPLGLTVLLLPLLAPELSRPRDSAWGAVLLLLGLDLVTSADRLTGAPMLGVLCGALLIGRLGLEVGLGRWRQLTEEEQQRLGSLERWSTSFRQLGITSTGLLERAGAGIGNLTAGIGQLTAGSGGLAGGAPARSGGKRKGKRWVRPETAAESPSDDAGPATAPAAQAGGDGAITPGSQDVARSAAPSSYAAAPPPEAAEGLRSPSELPGHSEPVAASAVSPAGLLPAPTTTDQDLEPAAAPAAPEPESSPPAAVADPAPSPSPFRELESGA
ncbi:MAG: Ycf66 family protein [Cyanobacteria bacterium]|nr:Ycf66 family protein [Cyanobacteriota bacterium]